MKPIVDALGIIALALLTSAISAALVALWVGFWVWVTPFSWMEVSVFMILVTTAYTSSKVG